MFTTPPRLPRFPLLSRRAVSLGSRLALCLLAWGLVLCVNGCSSLNEWAHNGFKVGPNYKKPPAPVASEWIDSKSKKVNTTTGDLSNWWTVFNDPVLNSLIEEAYRQNLDVRTAGTRILAARAQRNIAAGNLWPQLQEAFADSAHVGVSRNLANTPPNRFFDHNGAGFNLAWELDFWGRFRRAIEAADAVLDASVENYDDALVIMIGEVASTYVEIRVFQQRLKYVDDNIVIQTKLVKAAEGRLSGGVGRLIDQGQQRSNLHDTLALKKLLEQGLRLANNRLCVLLGVPVNDLMPKLNGGPIPVTPPEVIVGMPADLLRRRPDIRAAERLVAEQSARIGIAVANLYPRFSIIGVLGFEAENFSELFSGKSLSGSIGPSMRWDILNYGRLLNGIRVQDALFQTRALDYQNTVLRAGREVEDGIVLFLQAQKRTRELITSAREAKVAADEAVTLSEDVKFDLNQAFVTSNFLTTQQDKLAVSTGDIALGLIQVYKALGGGWEIRCRPEETDASKTPEPLPVPQTIPNGDQPPGATTEPAPLATFGEIRSFQSGPNLAGPKLN